MKQSSGIDAGASNPGAAGTGGRIQPLGASNAEVDRRLASLYQELVAVAETKARLAAGKLGAK